MTSRTRRIALTAAALLLLVAVPAFAASLTMTTTRLTAWQSATSVCGSPGTQTAASAADSWIDQGAPATNKGTDSVMKVTSKSGNANTRALVRFTLPTKPAGCNVTLARLRLNAASAVTGRTLQTLQVNAAWTETGVTWANQPATTGTAVTTTSATGYREWTVTTMTAAMYSGTNNGFLIRDATESAAASPVQSFHPRETTPNTPQLVITFG